MSPWIRTLFTLLATVLLFVVAPAKAGPLDDPSAPDSSAYKKDKNEPTAEEKTEEQKKAEEEAERKRRELLARVVVLPHKVRSTDYTDETLQREVRSRISRPEAMFFPEVDLYQSGRKVPDRTLAATQQPAVVPDSVIPEILAAVESTSRIPWNGMPPAQWGLKAQELRTLADKLWFVDRVNLRELMFMLYTQIGMAAENENNPSPPNYELVGGITVNYAWYLAALLAYQEPALMSKISNPDIVGPISNYLTQLQRGTYPSYKVDFEQDSSYDAEQFNKDYEILINGIPVELDADAQVDVFLGRTDIYLKRKDSGHGLAERLDTLKMEEKTVFLREIARKKMGTDFIDQLFLNKLECYPNLDGDILNYLAIYQKLHPKADIFVAVPENGNPNKTWIWRYEKESGRLKSVGNGPDAFPVRFAFLFSSGIMYNWGSPTVDKRINEPTPSDILDPGRASLGLGAAVVPFDFELRLHYNRLMINFGSEFGLAIGGNQFTDYFQTPGKYDKLWEPGKTGITNGVGTYDLSGCGATSDKGVADCQVEQVYNNHRINRHLYFGPGIVLGRNAGIGFGPRFAAQVGWVNLPHSLMTTGHFGWAIQPPIPAASGRVRPMIDLDLRGGVAIARRRSLQWDYAELGDLTDDQYKAKTGNPAPNPYVKENRVEPVLGINLGIGLTF